jgi:Na+:H+ antiporter, NhaA family
MKWFDRAATGLLVACALVLTFIVARRELAGGATTPTWSQPKRVADWQRYHTSTKTIGSPTAPVSILVFSDFQCPFCARFAESLKRVRLNHSREVRIVFRSFPIARLHPHARAAAAAAECAAQRSAFAQLHDLLFDRPDSIGVWSWSDVGARVGVADRDWFTKCMGNESTLTRIRDDSTAASALGLTGTPTVMVNRWLLPSGAPPDSVLDALISKELKLRAER